GEWTLTGTKTAVPYAPESDALLVSAMTPDGVGVFGVSTPDAEVVRQGGTDHRSIGTVALDHVRVGPDSRLGGDGVDGAEGADGAGGSGGSGAASGHDVLERILSRGTVGVCAEQFGILERALELTSAYAREREQFG